MSAQPTARFLGPGDPDHLDADSAYHIRPGQVLRVLTRTLYGRPASRGRDRPFEPVPDAACELPRVVDDSGRTVLVPLRSGMRWDTSPPRPLSAGDAVRGLMRTVTPLASADAQAAFRQAVTGLEEHASAYAIAFGSSVPDGPALQRFEAEHPVRGLRVLDDRTLAITLRRPANDLAELLSLGCAAAAPAVEGRFHPGAASAGPYRLTVARPGELDLTPNPAWGPATDPVRRREIARIRIGGAVAADPAWGFGTTCWDPRAADDDPFPASYPGHTLNPYIVLNLRSPNEDGALADVRVRRAIAYAIDRRAVAEIMAGLPGVAVRPQHSVIAPGNLGHRQFDAYPTPDDRGDPEAARRLLAAAGRRRVRLVAAVRDVGLHRAIIRSIACSLARCGIEVVVTLDRPQAYFTRLMDDARARAGDWDISAVGWTPEWFGNNGRALVQPLVSSRGRGGTYNYGGYDNPDVDATIERALETPDLARAATLWHQADRMIMDDVPIVPVLAFACRCCAARTASAGWSPHAGSLWAR